MKFPSLRGAALGLTLLASSCSKPPPISEPEEIATNEYDEEVQSFVDCTSERIQRKILDRRKGEVVPPTTESDVMACAEPAFDLTGD